MHRVCRLCIERLRCLRGTCAQLDSGACIVGANDNALYLGHDSRECARQYEGVACSFPGTNRLDRQCNLNPV